MDGRAEEEDGSAAGESTDAKCCCLLVVVLLVGVMVVLSTAALVLVLRPKKPVFSLHAIQMEKLKLNVSKSKEVLQLLPSSASLTFVACNPNKVGIRYGSTELGVMYVGTPVGVIRVPAFYQPPRSENLVVVLHLRTFRQLNLTQLMNREFHSRRGSSLAEIRIVGSIKAHLNLINFSLPTIKMLLDCQLTIDYGGEAMIKRITYLKKNKALLVSSLPHFLQKCNFSPYL